jgi:energy-coupling factor transport system ATP-binding protein
MQNGAPREILPEMRFSPPVVELGAKLGWEPLPLSIEEAQPFVAGLQDTVHKTNHKSPVQENQNSPLMSCAEITSGYNGRPVLKDVNLELHGGEILALMGANGAGKTTLLRSLVGFQKPDAGRVLLDGRDVTAGDVAEICREVGYLPQDPNSLLFAERVEDELLITLKNHGMENTNSWTGELLERLGLSDFRENYPRDMSVGQRQRIALGAIMVTRPVVLLLDEPTRGLDPESKAELQKILAQWRAEGKAVLLVTHDVELVASAADRVAFMEDGQILLQGEPAQVFSEPQAFMPQITHLFPHNGWLTVQDVLEGLKN